MSTQHLTFNSRSGVSFSLLVYICMCTICGQWSLAFAVYHNIEFFFFFFFNFMTFLKFLTFFSKSTYHTPILYLDSWKNLGYHMVKVQLYSMYHAFYSDHLWPTFRKKRRPIFQQIKKDNKLMTWVSYIYTRCFNSGHSPFAMQPYAYVFGYICICHIRCPSLQAPSVLSGHLCIDIDNYRIVIEKTFLSLL